MSPKEHRPWPPDSAGECPSAAPEPETAAPVGLGPTGLDRHPADARHTAAPAASPWAPRSGEPDRPEFYYPHSQAFPGAGVSGIAHAAGDPPGTPTPPSGADNWTAASPADGFEVSTGRPPVGGSEDDAHHRAARDAARHSGRFRMWFALLGAVLAVAAAATIGVVSGYRTAANQANANYGPRLQAAESSIASYRSAAVSRSNAEAAVPDLKAISSRFFDADAEISGSADALDITIPDSRVLTDLPALRDFLTELGFSDAVLDRMTHTRALDGTLTAQGHHCNVSWTYHPDHGLQMVFEATPGN